MVLIGPKNSQKVMQQSTSFTGDYENTLDVLELPTDLTSPLMSVDSEESKSEVTVESASLFKFINETQRVAYQDELLTVYPLKAVGKNGEICYSYIGLPAQGKAKFLAKNAKDLGCEPKRHNKLLYEG